MFGEQEATVLEVTPLAIHGQSYVDVTLGFSDRTTDRSRLGPESVPEGLERGEPVLVTRVANIVVSIRRP
jgi:hypothetical protein